MRVLLKNILCDILLMKEEDNSFKTIDSTEVTFELSETTYGYDYIINTNFKNPSRVRVYIMPIEGVYKNIIPCNIHGDNNAEKVLKNEFPVLSNREDDTFASPDWEFRADRSSHCISMLWNDASAIGIMVEPYAFEDGRIIRNGVFAKLDNKAGVSIGYRNYPVTFLNKREALEQTESKVKKVTVKGKIYVESGIGYESVHKILRYCYEELRCPSYYEHTSMEAVKGILHSLIYINYSKEFKNYTNLALDRIDKKLKPWRPLVEIGWTGGAVLAYPLIVAQQKLQLEDGYFNDALSGKQIIQEILNGYCEKSGFLHDITRVWDERWSDSLENGWWAGYDLAKDCHCAYTNGSALYYILKTIYYAKENNIDVPDTWLNTCVKVMDTVCDLQREDGNLGYTYCNDKREVIDWDGFAGCWFAAALCYLHRLTGIEKYLIASKKAAEYYYKYVIELNCYGTPMDTWKSVDEEGNLAFIKTSHLLHRITKEEKYLKWLKDSLDYECMWRYAFKAIPEFKPLAGSNFNSCGGSITSVSNPHLHPMGLITIEDFYYYYSMTKDDYYKSRGYDSYAWAMGVLELYPDISGYGEYGVMTERYCPSDGLTIEKNIDGTPASMWFSYNGWAAANALEGIMQ